MSQLWRSGVQDGKTVYGLRKRARQGKAGRKRWMEKNPSCQAVVPAHLGVDRCLYFARRWPCRSSVYGQPSPRRFVANADAYLDAQAACPYPYSHGDPHAYAYEHAYPYIHIDIYTHTHRHTNVNAYSHAHRSRCQVW